MVGTQCMDPADIPAAQRALTVQDVLSAIRRIGLPAAEVRGPAYTLVNLRTTFYTEPQTIDRSLDIIGYDVDLHVEPTSFTWSWGDGSATVTSTPGRPYPSTDVTHTYTHATDDGESLRMSVEVAYRARYRVDGQDWIDIDEPITVAGPARSLPIRQASAVLVQPD